MTAPPPPDGRKSPSRSTPRNLTTSIFSSSKSKKADSKAPLETAASRVLKTSPQGEGRRESSSCGTADEPLSPLYPPSSPTTPSHKHKHKLTPSNTFNTHYRSISKSMNDLGNIFSRGRSPPNRETSPRRLQLNTLQEDKKKAGPESPRMKYIDLSNVPSISIIQHGETATKDAILKVGWLNIVDPHSVRKGPLRDAWKLQLAKISGNNLFLYKPPSHLGIKSFDVAAPSEAAPARPQTAPAIASPSFNSPTLKHRSITRHPDLVINDNGAIKGGSVEALCHELLFSEDKKFVKGASVTLPAWVAPEVGLCTLIEYSTIHNSSLRIGQIVPILLDSAPNLLLESSYHNLLRLLVEKGVTLHDQTLAKSLREKIENKLFAIKPKIEMAADVTEVSTPSIAEFPKPVSFTLTADEFLQISPEVIAQQLHIFHLNFLAAWNPAEDVSTLLLSPHMSSAARRNPLVFTTANTHFITDKVFQHVLSGDAATSLNYRVNMLSLWLEVAERLKRRGDMVGWLAIVMAVSSPAILRLRETWSLVDPVLVEFYMKGGRVLMMTLDRRKLSHSQKASKEQEAHVFAPEGIGLEISQKDVVPYFGDLCRCMDTAYGSSGSTVDIELYIEGIKSMLKALEKWKQWFSSRPAGIVSSTTEEQKEVEQLQRCLRELNQNNITPQPIHSPTYFDMSIACESSSIGMYLQSHYHQRLPLSTGANVPLLFTDVIPRFSLFDKDDALAFFGGYHHKKSSSSNYSPQANVSGPSQSNQNLQPPSSKPLRRVRSFPPSGKPLSAPHTTGYEELDFTTRQRTAGLLSCDEAMLRAIRDMAGVSQKLFYSKDGELVLKAITEESKSSRPSSVIEVASSNRISSASRRISAQMNSNQPSPRISVHGDGNISPKTFDLEFLPELGVVPKGGTLERLVDILVLGVEDFSRRMNSDGESGTQPSLTMDMNVFTWTFFSTFRSYCSPIVLLDYLRKRLIGSRSAATTNHSAGDDIVFPDWTGVDHVRAERIDWVLVARIHIGILEALNLWVSEFFIDFYSDQALSESFLSFIGVAKKELLVWDDEQLANNAELRKAIADIEKLWKDLKTTFAKQIYTPFMHVVPTPSTPRELKFPASNAISETEDLVNSLETAVRQALKRVKLVDWMLAFEILEIQSSEPLGFFVPKMALVTTNEEDLNLQDMFFLLENIRRVNSNDTLLESMPTPLQDLCILHRRMGDWVLAHITDISLSLETRTRRIAMLLRGLAICRKRMSSFDLYEMSNPGPRQHIPSFVESAIGAALVRPESRIFNAAWVQAADEVLGSAHQQIDTLEQVVPKALEGMQSSESMTPCVGWLIERMLEIICYVPNMLVENNRLINFDKRRYIYNLIHNFTASDSCSAFNQKPQQPDLFCFPRNFETDRRALRDAAQRENQGIRVGRLKIFWRLFYLEQDKLRRDAKQREIIERQQKDQFRAAHRRQPTLLPEPSKRGGKRLGVNTLMKAVRPISMALTNSWTPPQSSGRAVSPFDLPLAKGMEHGRKPTMVIELAMVASISCAKSSRDRFMWRMKSDSGTSYLFQAISEADLDEWLTIIATVRGIAISDGAESVDGLTVLSSRRVALPVFGVPLEELCKRDSVKVPVVVEALLDEIESRGLNEVGIYRVPGSISSINALKQALDSGEEVRMDDDRWYDINAIAGAFKLFMRELPGQSISTETLSHLRTLTAELPNEQDKIHAYRNVMLSLPIYTYNFLRRVYLHFQRISTHAAINKMHAVNLAIVFGMGLSPELSTPLGVSPDLGLYQTMVKIWIQNASIIFPEVDDDEENEHESVYLERPESSTDTPLVEDAPLFSLPVSTDQSINDGQSYQQELPVTTEKEHMGAL